MIQTLIVEAINHLLWDQEKGTSFSGPRFLVCREVHQKNSNHLTKPK